MKRQQRRRNKREMRCPGALVSRPGCGTLCFNASTCGEGASTDERRDWPGPLHGHTVRPALRPADRPHAQPLPRGRRVGQARQAAGPRLARTREPARHLRTHARKGPGALPGQAQRPAGDGPSLRRDAELQRRARRRATPARAVHRQPRRAGDGSDAAAGPAGHRQDPFRTRDRAAAGHRPGLHQHEQPDRRLGAVGRVQPMERGAAGQGLRDPGRRRVRQPRDGGRRDRQGPRRACLRPAGRALQPARTRHRRRVHRRVRRGSRSTPAR